jgi:pyruvate-ferredoxin/flavodoxin oxidoreductase
MAMGAHTGCNTVYGSTPPNNPHPYPWMNSLFQDGITVTWLMGESFIMDHARRSVIPERLADALVDRETDVLTPEEHYLLAHSSSCPRPGRWAATAAWATSGTRTPRRSSCRTART